MADTVSKEKRSEIMRAIKSGNTGLELLVRQMLHKAGYRFRLHRKDLPGNPDLVFLGKKKVVFVHGCFWHHHPDPSCKISHRPKTNNPYWNPKLARTVARDEQNLTILQEQGWATFVIWECELKKDVDGIFDCLKQFLDE